MGKSTKLCCFLLRPFCQHHSGKDEPTSAEGGQEREPREYFAGQQRRHNGDGQSRGEGFEPAEQQKHKRHCHKRAQCQRKAPPMVEQQTSEGAQAGGSDDERPDGPRAFAEAAATVGELDHSDHQRRHCEKTEGGIGEAEGDGQGKAHGGREQNQLESSEGMVFRTFLLSEPAPTEGQHHRNHQHAGGIEPRGSPHQHGQHSRRDGGIHIAPHQAQQSYHDDEGQRKADLEAGGKPQIEGQSDGGRSRQVEGDLPSAYVPHRLGHQPESDAQRRRLGEDDLALSRSIRHSHHQGEEQRDREIPFYGRGEHQGVLFFLCGLLQRFQCAAELVGAGGGLPSAADAVEFLDDVVDFLSSNKAADALEVSVASAIKEDLLDDALVIDGHIDELRAGALGFVEGVGHNGVFCVCLQFVFFCLLYISSLNIR